MQHILIGDFLTGGGIQLLWPITQTWYGIGVPMKDPVNVLVEWVSFLVAVSIMLATRDICKLFKKSQSILLLLVPILTVLLPSLLQFPLIVPPSLLIPHLVYLGFFVASLLIFLISSLKKSQIG